MNDSWLFCGPYGKEILMDSHIADLFPEQKKDIGSLYTTGILPSQKIIELIDAGHIKAENSISKDQIQPASIDLRLGPVAYRVRASFLPGKDSTVEKKLEDLAMHTMDIAKARVLGA